MTRLPWQPAAGVASEIVVANIRHPLEAPTHPGKPRPAVLLRRIGGRWRLMGLTRQARRAAGQPRPAVVEPERYGLDSPSYLWGWPTDVSVLDIHRHIGWADITLAAAIIKHGCLDAATAASLVEGLDYPVVGAVASTP